MISKTHIVWGSKSFFLAYVHMLSNRMVDRYDPLLQQRLVQTGLREEKSHGTCTLL